MPLLGLCLASAGGCNAREAPAARSPVAVFAASSLTEAFQECKREVEKAHPELDIQLSFAGSQVLRLQIEQGAGADVFASADESHMQALADAGLVSRAETFAHNELVVILPRNNPAHIDSFDGLTRARRIVIGTDSVPVGIYARRVLDRAAARLGQDFAESIRSHVVSEESNVRLVRTKVELGEADAAIVYRTDAAASDRVRVVDIPEEFNVRASYQISPVARTRRAAHTALFIGFVLSDEGRRILHRHGFVQGPP